MTRSIGSLSRRAVSSVGGAALVVCGVSASAWGAPPGVRSLPALGSTRSAITPASPPASNARRGVVVISVGETGADAAWPVAREVYADAALRPAITDRNARVLAGEPTPEGASAETRDLAELRARITGDDAASRALLGELARRTGARAIVVVTSAATGATGDASGSISGESSRRGTGASMVAVAQTRVYDAAQDRLESTLHRAEKGSWTSLLDVLRARFAPPAAGGPPSLTDRPDGRKKDGDKGRETFVASPWFWGALCAAVLGGVVVYAATRDSGAQAPVRVQWGN